MSLKVLILWLLPTLVFGATRVTAIPGGTSDDKYWIYNTGTEACPGVTSDTLRIGSLSAGTLQLGSGWQFVDINVPKNAIIVSCSLMVKTRAASSGSPTIGAYISWAQSDNISDLGSCYDQTSISFTLGLSSWSANTEYKWDLGSSGIQAIVNRAGWVANNDAGLYISDDGSSDDVIGLQALGSYTSTLIINYNDPPSGFISARNTNAAVGVRGTNTGSSVRGKQ